MDISVDYSALDTSISAIKNIKGKCSELISALSSVDASILDSGYLLTNAVSTVEGLMNGPIDLVLSRIVEVETLLYRFDNEDFFVDLQAGLENGTFRDKDGNLDIEKVMEYMIINSDGRYQDLLEDEEFRLFFIKQNLLSEYGVTSMGTLKDKREEYFKEVRKYQTELDSLNYSPAKLTDDFMRRIITDYSGLCIGIDAIAGSTIMAYRYRDSEGNEVLTDLLDNIPKDKRKEAQALSYTDLCKDTDEYQKLIGFLAGKGHIGLASFNSDYRKFCDEISAQIKKEQERITELDKILNDQDNSDGEIGCRTALLTIDNVIAGVDTRAAHLSKLYDYMLNDDFLDLSVDKKDVQADVAAALKEYKSYYNNVPSVSSGGGFVFDTRRTAGLKGPDIANKILYSMISNNGEVDFGNGEITFFNKNAQAFVISSSEDDTLSDYSYWASQMTDDEKRCFYYVWNKEGANKAYDYLKGISDVLDNRWVMNESAKDSSFALDHKAGASALSVLFNPVEGWNALEYSLQQWARDDKMNQTQLYSHGDTMRGTVSQALTEDSEIKGFLYNVGMSMADNVYSMVLSGGNATVSGFYLGLGSYNDNLNDALSRGLSDDDAIKFAMASAGIEWATEAVSIDNLLKIKPIKNLLDIDVGDVAKVAKLTDAQKKAKKILKPLETINDASDNIFRETVLKNLDTFTNPNARKLAYYASNVAYQGIKQGVGEGNEEVISAVVGRWADDFIADENSAYLKEIEGYVNSGYSESEAIAMANKSFKDEMLQSFLSGFCSGDIMGSGQVGIGLVSNDIKANNILKEYYDPTYHADLKQARIDMREGNYPAVFSQILNDPSASLDQRITDANKIVDTMEAKGMISEEGHEQLSEFIENMQKPAATADTILKEYYDPTYHADLKQARIDMCEGNYPSLFSRILNDPSVSLDQRIADANKIVDAMKDKKMISEEGHKQLSGFLENMKKSAETTESLIEGKAAEYLENGRQKPKEKTNMKPETDGDQNVDVVQQEQSPISENKKATPQPTATGEINTNTTTNATPTPVTTNNSQSGETDTKQNTIAQAATSALSDLKPAPENIENNAHEENKGINPNQAKTTTNQTPSPAEMAAKNAIETSEVDTNSETSNRPQLNQATDTMSALSYTKISSHPSSNDTTITSASSTAATMAMFGIDTNNQSSSNLYSDERIVIDGEIDSSSDRQLSKSNDSAIGKKRLSDKETPLYANPKTNAGTIKDKIESNSESILSSPTSIIDSITDTATNKIRNIVVDGKNYIVKLFSSINDSFKLKSLEFDVSKCSDSTQVENIINNFNFGALTSTQNLTHLSDILTSKGYLLNEKSPNYLKNNPNFIFKSLQAADSSTISNIIQNINLNSMNPDSLQFLAHKMSGLDINKLSSLVKNLIDQSKLNADFASRMDTKAIADLIEYFSDKPSKYFNNLVYFSYNAMPNVIDYILTNNSNIDIELIDRCLSSYEDSKIYNIVSSSKNLKNRLNEFTGCKFVDFLNNYKNSSSIIYESSRVFTLLNGQQLDSVEHIIDLIDRVIDGTNQQSIKDIFSSENLSGKMPAIIIDKLLSDNKYRPILEEVVHNISEKDMADFFEKYISGVQNTEIRAILLPYLTDEQFISVVTSYISDNNILLMDDKVLFLEQISYDKYARVKGNAKYSDLIKSVSKYVDISLVGKYKEMIDNHTLKEYLKGLTDYEFLDTIELISKQKILDAKEIVNVITKSNTSRFKQIYNNISKTSQFEKYSSGDTNFGVDQNVTRKHVTFTISDISWLNDINDFADFIYEKYKTDGWTQQQAMNFAKSLSAKNSNINYGAYDTITGYLAQKYSTEEVMAFTRESFTRKEDTEYSRVLEKLTSKGLDQIAARQILDCIDSTGVCTYASVGNLIFDYYKDMPEQFKKDFSFELFIEVNGNRRINEIELLTDMYMNINSNIFGGKLFDLDQDGNLTISGNKIDTEYQLYLSNESDGIDKSIVNAYLKSKNSSLSITSEVYKNYDYKSAESIRAIFANALRDKKFISLGMYNSYNKSWTFRTSTGTIRDSSSNWGDMGHEVYVVGIDMNNVIVSTWSGKRYIPLTDFIDNHFTISVLSNNQTSNVNLNEATNGTLKVGPDTSSMLSDATDMAKQSIPETAIAMLGTDTNNQSSSNHYSNEQIKIDGESDTFIDGSMAKSNGLTIGQRSPSNNSSTNTNNTTIENQTSVETAVDVNTTTEPTYTKVDVNDYVQQGLANGSLKPVTAEKFARITAKQGTIGETVITWSTDANGNPIQEKIATVGTDSKTNEAGWIVTKVDANGNPIVDANGNINQWIIEDSVFKKKYEKDSTKDGMYKPTGGAQQFVQITDDIILEQWGSEMKIAAGGYINITNEGDMYGISARDFADTYKITENNPTAVDVNPLSTQVDSTLSNTQLQDTVNSLDFATMSKEELSNTIHGLVEQGYLLNENTPDYLKNNPEFIIESLKKADPNTIKAMAQNIDMDSMEYESLQELAHQTSNLDISTLASLIEGLIDNNAGLDCDFALEIDPKTTSNLLEYFYNNSKTYLEPYISSNHSIVANIIDDMLTNNKDNGIAQINNYLSELSDSLIFELVSDTTTLKNRLNEFTGCEFLDRLNSYKQNTLTNYFPGSKRFTLTYSQLETAEQFINSVNDIIDGKSTDSLQNLLNSANLDEKSYTVILHKCLSDTKYSTVIEQIVHSMDTKSIGTVINNLYTGTRGSFNFSSLISSLTDSQFTTAIDYIVNSNLSSMAKSYLIGQIPFDKYVSIKGNTEYSNLIKNVAEYVDVTLIDNINTMILDGTLNQYVNGLSDAKFMSLIEKLYTQQFSGANEFANKMIELVDSRIKSTRYSKEYSDFAKSFLEERISRVKQFEQYGRENPNSGDYNNFGLDQNTTRKHVSFTINDISWLKDVNSFATFIQKELKLNEKDTISLAQELLTPGTEVTYGRYDLIIKYLSQNYTPEEIMTFSRNSFTRKDDAEYTRMLDKLTSKGIDEISARQILDCMNTTGICSYASIGNLIFDYYKDMPDQFKHDFGFDLYVEVNGEQRINEIELLTDMYININSNAFGGKLFNIDQNGQLTISGNKIDTKNQIYLSYSNSGVNSSIVNDYLQSKNSPLSLTSEVYSTFSQKSPYHFESVEDAKQFFLNALQDDKFIDLGVSHIKAEDKGWLFETMDGEINQSSSNWNEGVGHAIYVVGVEADRLIVSSWGQKLYIPLHEFIDNKFTISILSNNGTANMNLNNNVDTSFQEETSISNDTTVSTESSSEVVISELEANTNNQDSINPESNEQIATTEDIDGEYELQEGESLANRIGTQFFAEPKTTATAKSVYDLIASSSEVNEISNILKSSDLSTLSDSELKTIISLLNEKGYVIDENTPTRLANYFVDHLDISPKYAIQSLKYCDADTFNKFLGTDVMNLLERFELLSEFEPDLDMEALGKNYKLFCNFVISNAQGLINVGGSFSNQIFHCDIDCLQKIPDNIFISIIENTYNFDWELSKCTDNDRKQIVSDFIISHRSQIHSIQESYENATNSVAIENCSSEILKKHIFDILPVLEQDGYTFGSHTNITNDKIIMDAVIDDFQTYPKLLSSALETYGFNSNKTIANYVVQNPDLNRRILGEALNNCDPMLLTNELLNQVFPLLNGYNYRFDGENGRIIANYLIQHLDIVRGSGNSLFEVISHCDSMLLTSELLNQVVPLLNWYNYRFDGKSGRIIANYVIQHLDVNSGSLLFEAINHCNPMLLTSEILNQVVSLLSEDNYRFDGENGKIVANYVVQHPNINLSVLELAICNCDTDLLTISTLEKIKSSGYHLSLTTDFDALNAKLEPIVNQQMFSMETHYKNQLVSIMNTLGAAPLAFEGYNGIFSSNFITPFGIDAVCDIYKYVCLPGTKIDFENLVANYSIYDFKKLYDMVYDTRKIGTDFDITYFENLVDKYTKSPSLFQEILTRGASAQDTLLLKRYIRNNFDIEITSYEEIQKYDSLIQEKIANTIETASIEEAKDISSLLLFNRKYSDMIDFLYHIADSKRLRLLASRLDYVQAKEVLEGYAIFLDFFENKIQNNDNITQVKDFVRRLNAMSIEEREQILKLYDDLEKTIKYYYGLELNKSLTNLNELGEENTKQKGLFFGNKYSISEEIESSNVPVDYIEINSQYRFLQHTLNAYGSGGKLIYFMKPKVVGSSYICLSLIGDNKVGAIRDSIDINHVTILFDNITPKDLVLLGAEDLASYSDSANNLEVKVRSGRTRRLVFDIVDNVLEKTDPSYHNEYTVYRNGAKPAGILVTGDMPTQAEIDAAATLGVPLVKINNTSNSTTPTVSSDSELSSEYIESVQDVIGYLEGEKDYSVIREHINGSIKDDEHLTEHDIGLQFFANPKLEASTEQNQNIQSLSQSLDDTNPESNEQMTTSEDTDGEYELQEGESLAGRIGTQFFAESPAKSKETTNDTVQAKTKQGIIEQLKKTATKQVLSSLSDSTIEKMISSGKLNSYLNSLSVTEIQEGPLSIYAYQFANKLDPKATGSSFILLTSEQRNSIKEFIESIDIDLEQGLTISTETVTMLNNLDSDTIVAILDQLLEQEQYKKTANELIKYIEDSKLPDLFDKIMLREDSKNISSHLSFEQITSLMYEYSDDQTTLDDFYRNLSYRQLVNIANKLNTDRMNGDKNATFLYKQLFKQVDLLGIRDIRLMIKNKTLQTYLNTLNDRQLGKKIDFVISQKFGDAPSMVDTMLNTISKNRLITMIKNGTLQYDSNLSSSLQKLILQTVSDQKDGRFLELDIYGIDQDSVRKYVRYVVKNNWVDDLSEFTKYISKECGLDMFKAEEMALELTTESYSMTADEHDVAIGYLESVYEPLQIMAIERASFKQEADKRYISVLNKLVSQGANVQTATKILDCINTTGVCSYADIANLIFDAYKDDATRFKNDFGFELYNYVNGRKEVNATELLADMYVYINSNLCDGKLFNIVNGKITLKNLDIDTDEQQFLSGELGLRDDLVNKYLHSKNPNVSINVYSVLDISPKNNAMTTNELKTKVVRALQNGQQISLGIYKNKHKEFRFLDSTGTLKESTLSWDEGGGHAVYVTGINEDGIIVSTWGERRIIPLEDFADNSYCIHFIDFSKNGMRRVSSKSYDAYSMPFLIKSEKRATQTNNAVSDRFKLVSNDDIKVDGNHSTDGEYELQEGESLANRIGPQFFAESKIDNRLDNSNITPDTRLKMSDILHEIIKNGEEIEEEYYGVVVSVYKNIDKYLEQLDDIRDKIYLAQWCHNYDKVNELIRELSLSDYEKNKYLQLKSKNSEIDETINFRILSPKHKFLDNIMDMITTDSDIQYQILSMSDSRLKVFEKMYERLQTLTNYYNPYITTILRRMSYVSLDTHWQNRFHGYDGLLKSIDDLISRGYELSDKEIDTLLYLCTSSVQHNVPNMDEMIRFGEDNTIDNIEFEEIVSKAKQEKNSNNMKFAILAQAYGIHPSEASKICKRFDINGIEMTSENQTTFEMYTAIQQIVNEQDPDVLIKLYDEFIKRMKPEKDFRRIIAFENDLRKVFAHDLNRQVYKTDNQPFTEINGIKVYDAGTDFKMIVTAIGAYQSNFGNQENYSVYWNSPKIRSHGNCCSLIGNANLSMATVRNVILGFSTMSDNMLLLSGSSDINSTPDSRKFNTTDSNVQEYMSADEMLDNTRGDYNELVYERRDLSSNPKFYKKNPDYIVFIEEYENFDEMLEKYKDRPKSLEYLRQQREIQEKQWQETLKAAADFDIPIVKINRERVAKSEFAKLQQMINEFKITRNPNLLEQIITRFENNRVGNAGLHAPLREGLFSQKMMNMLLINIKNAINQETNLEVRNNLYHSLYNAIVEEQRKVDTCKYGKRNKQQIPGIDFAKELQEIQQTLASGNTNS